MSPTAPNMSGSKASTSIGSPVTLGSPALRTSPGTKKLEELGPKGWTKNLANFFYFNGELQLGPRFHHEPKPVSAKLIAKEWEAYEIREPSSEDRACRAPKGFLTVFLDMWKAGFRIPVTGFQRDCLVVWDCLLCHLLPNSWRVIAGFHRTYLLIGVEPSVELLQNFFHCNEGSDSGFTISAQSNKRWLKAPSSTHHDRQSFVFVLVTGVSAPAGESTACLSKP